MSQQPARPLILFTNDDGIRSPGLWAAAHALAPHADVLVVAPLEQQSGTGRSMPSSSTGEIVPQEDRPFPAYGVHGSPAQAVQHGVLEIAKRKPDLVVSGINYGENCGNGITISGTVGAAIEAASLGVPALAVSQQTAHNLHLTYSQEVDFGPAANFTRLFALWMLANPLPQDVDLLKLDLPQGVTVDTPWRTTRVSRKRVYWPVVPERTTSYASNTMGYRLELDPSQAEPDSDVYAVMHDGVVSISPVSVDMTSRTAIDALHNALGSAAKGTSANPTHNGHRAQR